MMTLTCGCFSASISATERPSGPGMSTSSRATSGRLSSTAGSTSVPSAHWAMTSGSVSIPSSAARATRTIRWSSAMSSVMMAGPRLRWGCRCPVTADDEAESVLGLLRAHRGADGLRSLLQSAQTGARPQRGEIGAAPPAVVADLATVRVECDDAASGAGVAADVRTALAHAPGEELAQLPVDGSDRGGPHDRDIARAQRAGRGHELRGQRDPPHSPHGAADIGQGPTGERFDLADVVGRLGGAGGLELRRQLG